MSRRALLVVRVLVFVAACAWLYGQGLAGQSKHGGWGAFLARAWWPVWLAMLLLSVLNWGLESAKWRRLVAPLEPVGRLKAFRATLAGTTVGLVTPNRTGEPVGRVLFLRPEHRWQGGAATAWGSMAQLITTVVLGSLAFLWWWPPHARAHGLAAGWGTGLAAVAAAAGAVSLLFFFRPGLLRRGLVKWPVLRRLGPPTEVLGRYPARTLAAVLLLSVVRYAVFAGQYVLLLAVIAQVDVRDAVLVVPVIYLMSALLPTMVLTDLGVRGSVAVALFAPLGAASAAVLMASLAIWLVNVALPAAAGAVILLASRIRAAA